MLDAALLRHLERSGVEYCVIGGVALAVHGYGRYTADVDLLTMDARGLRRDFWPDELVAEIRTGAADDPLGGLVRCATSPPHDVLVGRGYAMRMAVATAEPHRELGAPVATPLALVLLTLEAGGPQDRNDIVALVDAQRVLGTDRWVGDVPRHLARLSDAARACWQRVSADLT
ncbi:MAG TPA: hypothetical protein VFD92_15080 [Candidatus Binatia bacterium]|nr:hypothetical protein [Candidatus Binatia bacterium]